MKHNIDALLNKYWEGESSLDEEATLKEYYKSGDITEEHQAFKELFVYFDDQSKITYPNSDKKVVVRSLVIKKYMYAVAAVFVLGLTSTLVWNQYGNINQSSTESLVYEIEDPEEALEVTLQALALVSKKFNKSQQTVKENLAELEKAAIFKQ